MGKARTSGGGIAKRALVLLTLCVLFAAGVGTAAASGNGNGKPGSPPGQGECEHGNSGKPCRDDPQPEHGKDCQAHGNQGGVNEDHCGGVTTPDPPPPTTTVNQPPPPTTTVTSTTTPPAAATTTTTTTQTPTSSPSSPSPPPTTTKTSPPAPAEPKQEEPREERAPTATPAKATATPPKATTLKPNDAPAKAMHETAEPKQGVKAAATTGADEVDAGCAPPRVLAVAPKTAEGRLPFTGLPLWVFVLGGLSALLAGVGVRRLARAHQDAAE